MRSTKKNLKIKNKSKKAKVTSTQSLLGNPAPISSLGNECVICQKPIPQIRIDALQMLGTPRTRWTHTNCSTTTKIKGIYMGEVGTSKLQLCDKIYNDSVRSVFRRSEVNTSDDDVNNSDADADEEEDT